MLDPTSPESFNWKTAQVSAGHQYRYIDQSPQSSASPPVVLCLHGFPDLAMGWRYQIIDLVRRGYRVIVPDLLGFGGTSKPSELKAYSKLNTCKALVDILDHEKITSKVIIAAHDWGSVVAARFVQYFPQKVQCWVTVCVPPVPPSQPGQPPQDLAEVIRQRQDHFGYQIYFMSSESNEELTEYSKTFLLLVFYHWGTGIESAIEEKLAKFEVGSCVFEGVLQKQLKEIRAELESIDVKNPETRYILSEYKKGGLSAPLNWYRTHEIDQADEQAAALPPVFSTEIPCLFIGVTNDPALPRSFCDEIVKAKLFPGNNLTTVTIEGGTHFVLQHPKYRDEVSKVLGDWIDAQAFGKTTSKLPHHGMAKV